MFRKLILLFVSIIGFYSSATFAVGLGSSDLKSGLNQPLKAEIKLLSADELSAHEIHASLASIAEFEKVGVERLFFLSNIKFETVKGDDGSVKINLTSREPIKEPFLNFLVELNWPNGRIIREYTFLLDPPIFEENTSSTIQKSQVKKNENVAKRPSNQRTSSNTSNNQTNYTGSTYGPVSSTDTLWSIASKVRPSSQVSIHQTLVAIYRANPEAFGNGNINNLLRGKVLQIPDAATVSQVPQRAALQDVVMQNRQWKSGGARRIVDNTDTASEKNISSDARLTLATPSDNEKDSSGTGGNSTQEQLQNIQNELARTEEESATLQAENEELRSRLADALAKLEDVQSGAAVNISDAELAALSRSKNTDETASANLSDDNAIDSAVDTLDSDETLADTDTNASDTDINDDVAGTDTSDTATSDVTNDELTDDSTQAEVAKTEKVEEKSSKLPELKVYTPPKPEKTFMDELMESGMLLWGGIGLIVVILLAVFWRMRKKMEEDDFQDDLVASAGAGNADSSDSFELPDVGDDMLVELDMDDDDENASGESDDENFDPIGEADIYIAYGKYEQAETLLLEAIEDNPIRSDLKVKLMECYAENDDQEKFESLSEEVSQAIDAEEWQEQIANMREQAWGESSDSGEEDFDLPSTEDIFGEDEFSIDDESNFDNVDKSQAETLTGTEDDILELGDEEDNEEGEFDIDMDFDDVDEQEESSQAVTQSFDSLDDDILNEDKLEELPSDSLSDSELTDDELDLSFEDDELSMEEEAIHIEGSDELDDADDLLLDLDDDEFSIDDEISDFEDEEAEETADEIGTKLDLARAYIDMGDSEGAKEILAEVVAEGTEEQKQEAQSLLEKAN